MKDKKGKLEAANKKILRAFEVLHTKYREILRGSIPFYLLVAILL